MDNGLIFDIQRFALHDGYGIRTLVFMKGCPLRCEWCSNPESQSTETEIMFFEEKCINCGACIEACPHGLELKENWPILGSCDGCGACVDVCYAEARKLVGKWYSVDDVLDIVLRDRVFYEESKGGVTVGGGEPTMQASFVADLLEQCRANDLHTAIETCMFTSWNTFDKILTHTDLLLCDIKHMDDKTHKGRTGMGNKIILENAVKASKVVKDMIIRLPLIPGFNNGSDNIHALGAFIRNKLVKVKRVDILPYHTIGSSKAKHLGQEYLMAEGPLLTTEEINTAKIILQSYGLDVKIGGMR
jgi:pyruvate formate lyase activating enzyme